jgi:integrase/recombinase XerD
MLLLLLDTGIRASELCDLTLADLNQRTATITVTGKSRLDSGQGTQRLVLMGDSTRKAVWRYLLSRQPDPEDPLFADADGRRIDRRHLAKHLSRLGKRAGVVHVHPHRFRHTFAITYIQNGGDAYTLQSLLGHSSLDMVKRYLKIAKTDCISAHRRAGPVDHWAL